MPSRVNLLHIYAFFALFLQPFSTIFLPFFLAILGSGVTEEVQELEKELEEVQERKPTPVESSGNKFSEYLTKLFVRRNFCLPCPPPPPPHMSHVTLWPAAGPPATPSSGPSSGLRRG